MHSIIPKERESLLVLVFVNAAGIIFSAFTFSWVKLSNVTISSNVRTMLPRVWMMGYFF